MQTQKRRHDAQTLRGARAAHNLISIKIYARSRSCGGQRRAQIWRVEGRRALARALSGKKTRKMARGQQNALAHFLLCVRRFY